MAWFVAWSASRPILMTWRDLGDLLWASGSLRVRVYAGIDVLTGRALYLKRVIAAGPRAWEQAEAAREELVRQVRLGRQPRMNACLRQLLQRHLEVAQLGPRAK